MELNLNKNNKMIKTRLQRICFYLIIGLALLIILQITYSYLHQDPNLNKYNQRSYLMGYAMGKSFLKTHFIINIAPFEKGLSAAMHQQPSRFTPAQAKAIWANSRQAK